MTLDMYDDADGKGLGFLYDKAEPEVRYEVVSLLDRSGDDVTNFELAVGGIVKIADECFQIFTF